MQFYCLYLEFYNCSLCVLRQRDVELALENLSREEQFFGTKIRVEQPPAGFIFPVDTEVSNRKFDVYHPLSSRTLYVGNLERCISAERLRDIFSPFGHILV